MKMKTIKELEKEKKVSKLMSRIMRCIYPTGTYNLDEYQYRRIRIEEEIKDAYL